MSSLPNPLLFWLIDFNGHSLPICCQSDIQTSFLCAKEAKLKVTFILKEVCDHLLLWVGSPLSQIFGYCNRDTGSLLANIKKKEITNSATILDHTFDITLTIKSCTTLIQWHLKHNQPTLHDLAKPTSMGTRCCTPLENWFVVVWTTFIEKKNTANPGFDYSYTDAGAIDKDLPTQHQQSHVEL
ncbi:hypothetical protein BC941DRAFT_464650 [Chlamydoabsidia padenii]|nr:hypothetical protein BC941DRAFT_464650 [Chlamydoabsidia padenii]